jgi:hypothetical protein
MLKKTAAGYPDHFEFSRGSAGVSFCLHLLDCSPSRCPRQTLLQLVLVYNNEVLRARGVRETDKVAVFHTYESAA